MLALAYHAGTLLKQDDAQALQILRRAASRSFVAAEEAMGTFCQLGFGMPSNKAQAVAWYTKAAQHGSKDAATNLALMLCHRRGSSKKESQSIRLSLQNTTNSLPIPASLGLGPQ